MMRLHIECDGDDVFPHSVCWSPSGYRLAFASHDSAVHFVQILSGEDPMVQTVRAKYLPMRSILFLSDDCLVAAGYDANPIVYVNRGAEAELDWVVHDKLDKAADSPKAAQKGPAKSRLAIPTFPSSMPSLFPIDLNRAIINTF